MTYLKSAAFAAAALLCGSAVALAQSDTSKTIPEKEMKEGPATEGANVKEGQTPNVEGDKTIPGKEKETGVTGGANPKEDPTAPAEDPKKTIPGKQQQP